MDLGAYEQIESLGQVAEDNGIYVPRLRGYRLMKDEHAVDIKSWVKENLNGIEVRSVVDLCCSHWIPNSWWYEYSAATDKSRARYIHGAIMDEDAHVKWDKLHGHHRKLVKTEVHNRLVRYKKQLEMFNKYAGQPGILMIHARIGGGNWHDYYKEVVDKPWFLDKVDDAFDSTYCDIYARIEEV